MSPSNLQSQQNMPRKIKIVLEEPAPDGVFIAEVDATELLEYTGRHIIRLYIQSLVEAIELQKENRAKKN